MISKLEDRILTNKYHYQKYGTQWTRDKRNTYSLVPILKNIDLLYEKIDLSNIKTFENNNFLNMNKKEDREILNIRRFERLMEKIENYTKSNKVWRNSVDWVN